MRILFLGQIGEGQTSLMRMRALRRLGHTVEGVHTTIAWRGASWLSRQLQRRLENGPVVDGINCAVLEAAKEFRPELVWAEKQEYLRPETIAALKATGARLCHFTPDPYFSLSWKRTGLMDRSLSHFDALVYCKSYERTDYEAIGPKAIYMPLGYCDEVHRPIESRDDIWKCDVGFLGGWEPRRQELLSQIVSGGVDLKIRGVAWEFLRDGKWTLRRHMVLKQLAGSASFSFQRDSALAAAHQGGEVYGDDYARALSGARIGVGFLRAVCDDQHTTRTFEIPACGSMLLADRTDEHQSFFREGVEAEFFKDAAELVDKLTFYSAKEEARARVAAAGRRRCEDGRYAYVHRLGRVFAELALS